jgi:hypothetical protein
MSPWDISFCSRNAFSRSPMTIRSLSSGNDTPRSGERQIA